MPFYPCSVKSFIKNRAVRDRMEGVRNMAKERVRNYETTFIMQPELEEKEREDIIERIKDFITSNDGEINEVDEWGTKNLAYEINDYKTGYYTRIDFDSKTSLISELEYEFGIIGNIIRHIVVNKED